MVILQLIHDEPGPLRTTDSASDVRTYFESVGPDVNHAPVVDEDNNLVGTLAKRRLPDILDVLPLTTFVDQEPVRIDPEAHIFEAANVFRAHPQETLAVVEPDGAYYGVLHRKDVLACLSHMLATHKQGAVLVLEMPTRDYTLGQLVYVIEQNNAKILSISTEIEELEGGTTRVTLKMNVSDATRIRHVLGHYGYHVVDYYDTSTTADLQLRVQALMRYLEV